MRGASFRCRALNRAVLDFCIAAGDGVALQQIQDRWAVQTWADHSFRCGVGLCEKPAHPVAGGRDLTQDVIIKPTQHRELGD